MKEENQDIDSSEVGQTSKDHSPKKANKKVVRKEGNRLCLEYNRALNELLDFLGDRSKRDCLTKVTLEELDQDLSQHQESVREHIAVRMAQSESGKESGARARAKAKANAQEVLQKQAVKKENLEKKQ